MEHGEGGKLTGLFPFEAEDKLCEYHKQGWVGSVERFLKMGSSLKINIL